MCQIYSNLCFTFHSPLFAGKSRWLPLPHDYPMGFNNQSDKITIDSFWGAQFLHVYYMHAYIHTHHYITLHCIALHCITYLPYYWEWLSHPFPRALHTSCHSQSKPPLIATVPPVTLWNLGTVCWSNHMSVDQSCWLVRYASFWSTNPSCRFNEMVWNARWNPPKFNQTCTEAGCAVRTRP